MSPPNAISDHSDRFSCRSNDASSDRDGHPPAHTMTSNSETVRVESPDVKYSESEIVADYVYHTTHVRRNGEAGVTAIPRQMKYRFKTEARVPKVGVMLVGWGGNNGSTFTASILANRNKMSWLTKEGPVNADYLGSLVMASTVCLGVSEDDVNQMVSLPLRAMLPMVHPNDLVIGGWDISKANLAEAMFRAKVLEPTLQQQLMKMMSTMRPLPSIYYPDFIAANQEDRADNVLPGNDKSVHLEHIRNDIRSFKTQHGLEKVIVLWTANTERFSDVAQGVNDTADALLHSIRTSHAEVSPSTVFAVASIQEGCTFINGSPQNTLVPGVIELAQRHGVHVGGDDFKSGQTKLKSVLVDFLVNAGIKPISIASYNHLGNNDGRNLSAPQQFRSKEISKSSVVDDMVAANGILYKGEREAPDHTIVIKYMPAVGDSKRAMDEYVSRIFMGGQQTLAIYNVCEDSLLATPLMIDLVVLAELFSRISVKRMGEGSMNEEADGGKYQPFHPVLSVLSYMLKAPVVPPGTPVINSLARQRACVENILRACIGLQPTHEMGLEHKLFFG